MLFVKLNIPVSFEVDGIHENQTSSRINWIWRQQLYNFTFKEELQNQLAKSVLSTLQE